jgi:SAM-dependent methyltransferase
MNILDILSPISTYFSETFNKNGPDQNEYATILEMVEKIGVDEIEEFREVMQPILNPGTIIGFSFTKPFGYNGDFFIIEKIYQHYINPDPKYKKWDVFFHTFPAAIAVVNRKKIAIEILKKLNRKTSGNKSDVLILGSGPVSEVYEFFQEQPDSPLIFDLIDLDQRAIDYAKAKTKNYLSRITFYNANVIRHIPGKTYDLIWSAGLFDYFKDKHFVYLLKKYYEYIKPGGEMIIGNFNIENPSKKIMEILGDWFLNHRSEDELMRFAMQAGIPKDKIEITREPLGINLFLKVRK